MNTKTGKFKYIVFLFLIPLILSFNNFLFSQNTNYALQFDGVDDEVSMGFSSILDITGDITICVWYKTTSPYWGSLVSNFDLAMPDNGYQLCSSSTYNEGGFVYFECAHNDDRDGFSTNATFNDGQWHYIAAIYTPNGYTSGKVYVDGNLQTGEFWGVNAPLSAIGTTPVDEFKIGAGPGHLEYFNGVIDEVSIWNIALSQNKIVENMNKKFLNSDSGLVGYWPFDEGAGNTAYDYSGNNNHGIIHGANWIVSSAGTGGAYYFANPNHGYLNHGLKSIIRGVNTHFLDSLGTQNVWLSKYNNTINAFNFQVNNNTSLNAEFYIPSSTLLGFWDINIETAVDSIITMSNGIEILPPPKISNQNSGTFSWLKSVDIVDNKSCWIVGNDGTIIITIDGGLNWNSQSSGTSSSLNSVYFTDQNTGWVVGQSGLILNTTNSGLHWNSQTSGTANNLQSVYFIDSNTGWTVGGNGTILKTTDSGNAWNVQTSNTSSWLYSVYFNDVNNGWAVGSNGTILKTTDGGITWDSQLSGNSYYLFSVYFVDSDIGWISGSNGTILKTMDGGTTWKAQTSGTNTWLRSVYFKDSNTGWVVGNNGTILMTEDGGNSWTERKSFINKTLNSVCFADDTTGWVVGEAGTVLKMSMTELFTSIEEEPFTNSPLPVTFELKQNYPNPFNPNTIISYQLPVNSDVNLSIYSILGQKVNTIVSERQVAGNYKYSWDGRDRFGQLLSSGIYIYQIQAESYKQSRKMVFLR